MIEIRKMKVEEAKEVKAIGQRAFDGAERFFVSKPKEAMVATIDNKIVGAMIFNYIKYRDKKIAYVDFAYVDPKYHNQGIGRKLYKETFDYIWKEDCIGIITMVKDDNVASWKSLINYGFARTSFSDATKKLGLPLMIKQYFATPTFISNGMDLYLKVKDEEIKSKEIKTINQIAFYIVANLVLMMLGFFLNNRSNWGLYIGAYIGLLGSCIGISFIGTIISKRKWKFRVTNCGAALVAFLSIGAPYPLIGNWYPEEYDNSRELKKDMGIIAMLEWIFLMAITVISTIISSQNILIEYLGQIGVVFLIYRIIAVYPFEGFGGGRVYKWNKFIYFILAIISAIMIFIK